MKRLIIILALAFITLGPIPAHAEPCTGQASKTVDINEPHGFCWDPNPETDIKQYLIMRDGQVYDTVLHSTCAADRCDSPNYAEQVAGVYVFTVRAVDMGDNQSGDSDSVTLTVVDQPPGKPSGCSIRIPL